MFLNREKYTGEYFQIQTNLLNVIQIQRKQQKEKERIFYRKIKSNYSLSEYKQQLYSTGSSPGKFYGTAEKHKLS